VVEACTGGLFVYEALAAAGAVGHLAGPVETNALGGKKRRAKTDRADALWLRTLLCQGRWAEAWIPPAHVRGWGTRARLGKPPVDERPAWLRRVPATLFHRGVAGVPRRRGPASASRRAVRCAGLDLGVHRSDRRSRAGQLTRQGSPRLRWALYESAQAADVDWGRRSRSCHVEGRDCDAAAMPRPHDATTVSAPTTTMPSPRHGVRGS
jgi:hypothetical protein